MSPIDFAALTEGTRRLDIGSSRGAFVKVRHGMGAGFFVAEARGLSALAHTAAMRVPQVLAVGDCGIALEDLGSGRAQATDWQRAGRGLAMLHSNQSAQFGFDSNGWCGDSVQDNSPHLDGVGFFSERRLLPQAHRAHAAGKLGSQDLARIETLCMRLPELLPKRPAVLVHGDLWLGNLHICANGELALIDAAAVHFGWAEGDLAMLTLFGEPPAVFFDAYQAQAGIDASWRSRAPLLNLYHLLNHLNLFGESYAAAVRAVLARYA